LLCNQEPQEPAVHAKVLNTVLWLISALSGLTMRRRHDAPSTSGFPPPASVIPVSGSRMIFGVLMITPKALNVSCSICGCEHKPQGWCVGNNTLAQAAPAF
jgi:hypothetical protein